MREEAVPETSVDVNGEARPCECDIDTATPAAGHFELGPEPEPPTVEGATELNLRTWYRAEPGPTCA